MTAKPEDIRALLDIFNKSTWNEIRLETGGIQIAVSKTGRLSQDLRAASSPSGSPSDAAVRPTLPAHAESSTVVPRSIEFPLTPLPAGAPVAPVAQPTLGVGDIYLRAPNLGVVWEKPNPGAPPFVVEGQMVELGDTVCLIEVMKLFTQVVSTVRGRIVRCLVSDGDMVENDTPLFVIHTA